MNPGSHQVHQQSHCKEKSVNDTNIRTSMIGITIPLYPYITSSAWYLLHSVHDKFLQSLEIDVQHLCSVRDWCDYHTIFKLLSQVPWLMSAMAAQLDV